MTGILQFEVDGRQVEVADDGASLLEVLRDRLGVRSPKDGCSPQGQCGCCTVLVDGQPRVSCVTPARRVRGRTVVTVDGLDPAVRNRWASAFLDTGASQCGFCTPGIVTRLAALEDSSRAKVETALLAHLCRCTGWRTILDAAEAIESGAASAHPPRNLAAATRRATLEGRAEQRVGLDVVLGQGGFADDTAPLDALVAVLDDRGGWAVGETLSEARRLAGKVQGRRTTIDLRHPLQLPPGPWDVTLRTTWVDPGYLEPDASWCTPGGSPRTALANGGAFGGKRDLDTWLGGEARRLADEHGRSVRVVLTREDAVRGGPKRPPLAAGIRSDGTGIVRVARTAGVTAALRSVPGLDLEVEEVDVPGPPTSTSLRAAGWAEASVLRAAIDDRDGLPSVAVDPYGGGRAEASVDASGIHVRVACGHALDDVVLRSYCIGAAHMALGWVTSEGLSVDEAGEVHDLTIRSFGVLRARDMPPVDVEIVPSDDAPVNGSDAVFAAVAAAVWLEQGRPTEWPTTRGALT